MKYPKVIVLGIYCLGLVGSISVLNVEHPLLYKIILLFMNSITIFCAGFILGREV